MKNNKLKVYKNNQEICETGNFMIVEGMIVRHTSDQLINIIKEGEILFDDAEFLCPIFHYKAKGNVVLLEIGDTFILQSYEMLKKEAEQAVMKKIENKIKIMSLSAEERIKDFFIQVGEEIGIKEDSSCTIPAIFTQEEIAKYTFVTREYLNVILKRFCKVGLLEATRQKWIILFWEKWTEKEMVKNN
ncbi:Crp/Fnr family transcriptional regulator [Listeria grayi]|nr:Crp/Fnr family transcriptional regulator [Listeria grayi]